MGPHFASNMEPLVVNHNYHETKNKQHRLKSTNYNLQAQPFEPGEESACFPIGPLEWVTGAKNFNDSCTFGADIVVKKFLVDYKIKACVKEISPGFWIEKHCLVKHFAFLENVCYQY